MNSALKQFSTGVFKIGPGLALAISLSLAAITLQSWPGFSSHIPLSPLMIAIVIGMLIRNLIHLPQRFIPGIEFAGKSILRLAIIFLGFKLSAGAILSVGLPALLAVGAISSASILFTMGIGRLLGIPFQRTLLLAGGISICGASAVAAIASATNAADEDAAFAIGAVTLFGTIFMFGYPLLAAAWHLPHQFYALWSGASIHEVAQVAAAGSVIPEPWRGLSATVKMFRVLLIIPLTIVLSFLPALPAKERRLNSIKKPGKAKLPWFALGFFGIVLVNSFFKLPPVFHGALVQFGDLAMVTAMGALGLGLSFKDFAKIGPQALAAGAIGSIFISGFSALVLLILGAFTA